MINAPLTHQDLVLRAEKWLKNCGCGVVLRDPFRTTTQEQPDAIGWRDGVSLLVEAKVSRADFLKDKNKRFRKEPEFSYGMIEDEAGNVFSVKANDDSKNTTL